MMILKLVVMKLGYYNRVNEYGRYNCLICGKKVCDELAYFDYPVGRGWMHVDCVLDGE